MTEYKKHENAASAFDLGHFHQNCPPPQVLDQAGRIWLFCPECRVLANAEALGARISHDEAHLDQKQAKALRAKEEKANDSRS